MSVGSITDPHDFLNIFEQFARFERTLSSRISAYPSKYGSMAGGLA